MARSVAELFDEASGLDEHERATLAGLLLESIEQEPDPEIEEAWKIEYGTRRFMLPNFPFSIIYRVNENAVQVFLRCLTIGGDPATGAVDDPSPNSHEAPFCR